MAFTSVPDVYIEKNISVTIANNGNDAENEIKHLIGMIKSAVTRFLKKI